MANPKRCGIGVLGCLTPSPSLSLSIYPSLSPSLSLSLSLSLSHPLEDFRRVGRPQEEDGDAIVDLARAAVDLQEEKHLFAPPCLLHILTCLLRTLDLITTHADPLTT